MKWSEKFCACPVSKEISNGLNALGPCFYPLYFNTFRTECITFNTGFSVNASITACSPAGSHLERLMPLIDCHCVHLTTEWAKYPLSGLLGLLLSWRSLLWESMQHKVNTVKTHKYKTNLVWRTDMVKTCTKPCSNMIPKEPSFPSPALGHPFLAR